MCQTYTEHYDTKEFALIFRTKNLETCGQVTNKAHWVYLVYQLQCCLELKIRLIISPDDHVANLSKSNIGLRPAFFNVFRC